MNKEVRDQVNDVRQPRAESTDRAVRPVDDVASRAVAVESPPEDRVTADSHGVRHDRFSAGVPTDYRHKMDVAYQSAIRFGESFGAAHYNLGYAADANGDLRSCQEQLVERLIAATSIGPRAIVVDVGCGSGGAAIHIARTRHPMLTIGVDLCASNVVYARHQLEQSGVASAVRFVEGDAQALPLRSGSADVLFNLESAFHYPDKERFVSECGRVVRPGGTVLIGDLVCTGRFPQVLRAPGTYFWTERQYRESLQRAGLEIASLDDVSRAVHRSVIAAMRSVRREGIRRWWPCRRALAGVAVARFLLRCKLLRYVLIRAIARS